MILKLFWTTWGRLRTYIAAVTVGPVRSLSTIDMSVRMLDTAIFSIRSLNTIDLAVRELEVLP